jgi:curved DNA-binding protein CbpA
MMDLNPYEALDVPRDADEATIRKAYRKASKRAHPDAGGSEEAFAKVATSLAVLTDPKKRKTFDDTGRIEEDQPDNDRAAALSIVEGQIAAIVNEYQQSGFRPSNDPRKMDMPAEIVRRIKKELLEANVGLKGGAEHVTYLKDMARRFKLKNPADFPEGDPIVRGFELQVRRAEQQIADIHASIRVRELAVKIAEGYTFEADAPAKTDRNDAMAYGFTSAEYLREQEREWGLQDHNWNLG